MAKNTETGRNLSVLPGNEKKLTYKITPPADGEGRFSYAWNAFKRSLGSVILINLMMLVFFAPLVAIFYLRGYSLSAAGRSGPFGDNLGIGYPAFPVTTGLAEALYLKIDLVFFALALAASVVAALGVAGGVYSIRKVVRSEERWKFTDFFRGIAAGYLPALVACLASFVCVLLSVFVFDYAAYAVSLGANAGLWIFLRVLVCVFSVLVMLFSLWILAVGSNYRQSAWGTVRNAFVLGGGSIIPTVFFAAMAAAPVLLVIWNVLSFLGMLFYILFGFSYALIVWLTFTDWVFDRYAGYTAAQTEVQEAELKKAIEESTREQDVMSLLLVEGKSEYLSRAVLPLTEGEAVVLPPVGFTQEDLVRFAADRARLRAESEAYSASHAKEEKYKEYNARFADRDKVLVEPQKGKKKKFNPQMLGS